MHPHDTSAAPKPASWLRPVVSLALLVAVIGGIAWLVQFLPRGRSPQRPMPVTRDVDMVRFTLEEKAGNVLARWSNSDPNRNPFREFEPGDQGHYDFLFRNILGRDLEVVHYSSSCDCMSMAAAALPKAELDRLEQVQAKDPGSPLPYSTEPRFEDLPRETLAPAQLKIKPGEGGVVRVRWTGRKSPGQELKVKPEVWIQPAGDPGGRKKFALHVPALMTAPVRIFPVRVNVGVLTPGAKAKAEFDAWSATRDDFQLDLTTPGPDPFFVVETKPLSKEKRVALERYLNANKIPTRVKSAYHVTITVRETKDGQQLDLGVFHRKFAVSLNGAIMPEISGPEVIGRVFGDLVVGGADDQGKIRFPSFDASTGASKVVELLAPAAVKLKTDKQRPSWLKLQLTPEEKSIDGNKRIWILEVTVPPKTPGARSFDDSDAVVLRIEGQPPRFVRIPIEGQISGR